MTDETPRLHPAIPVYADHLKAGRIDRREFLRTTTLLGLSATAAYALAGEILGSGAIAPAAAQETPKKGGTIRISMRVPKLSDPATFQWVYDSNSARQVNEYLTRTGVDNVTRPYLLERWEASDDLKTWTLHLRQGIKWNNGDDFVADQVIWNLQRWLSPDIGSSILGLMEAYMLEKKDDKSVLWADNAIEKLDDHTIRLNLKVPQLAVPEHLFHYPALILHPSQNGEWGVGAIGTGAFTCEEVEIGRRVVLKAREDYWGEGPWIERLEFIDHGDDPAAALNALQAREVDGIMEASITQYQALKAMPHVDVPTIATAQTAVARMQPQHKPFDDPRVRKAMRLALDTEKLLQVAHLGLGAPAEHHHVAPVQPEYAPLPFMAQDIEGAKKLLAEAGLHNGFETEIHCKKDPAWELIAVEAMVEMWREIGVNVKINVMPSDQYWNVWTEVPFGFTNWTHRPLAVMLLPLAYRSGVPWNEAKWSNERMDALLLQAEATLDIEKRRAVMAEIQQLMQEEGPIAQPLWRAVFTGMDKKIKGFEIHPTFYLFAEKWWIGAA